MILGWRNYVMSGPITATAFITGFGPDNLQNEQGNASEAWQTPSGVTTASVRVDRSPGTRWRGFALARTNLTAAATVTWRVIDGGTAVYSAAARPVVPGFFQIVHVAPQDYIGSSMQVDIADPSNPDGSLNIPLMFGGPVFEPMRNLDFGSVSRRTSQGIEKETRSGGVFRRSDWTRRSYDISLSGIRASEVAEVEDIEAYAGQGNNVLFVPSVTATTINRDAIYGTLGNSSGLTYPFQTSEVRAWKITVSERL